MSSFKEKNDVKLNQLLEAGLKKQQEQKIDQALKQLDRNIYQTMLSIMAKGHLEEFELLTEAIHHAASSSDEKAVVLMIPDIVRLAKSIEKRQNDERDDAVFLNLRWTSHSIAQFLSQVLPIIINDEKHLKLLLKHQDELELAKFINEISPSLLLPFELKLKKLRSSAAEKRFHRENDTFIFVGRPKFKETPPGSGNYKKTLEIERLIKVDPYHVDDHKMIHMMQLRANAQGEDSKVYKVNLPKGSINEKDIKDPPGWLIDLIDKHKEKI